MIDLKAIKERESKATPGPWISIFGLDGRTVYDMSGEKGIVIAKLRKTKREKEHQNAEFIAHARDDIPALLEEAEEAERLRAEVERLTVENAEYKNLIVNGTIAGKESCAHGIVKRLTADNAKLSAELEAAVEMVKEKRRLNDHMTMSGLHRNDWSVGQHIEAQLLDIESRLRGVKGEG